MHLPSGAARPRASCIYIRQRTLACVITYTYIYIYIYIYIYLLYKAEKPSVRIFLVEWIFAVDARIHVKLARNEAPIFWEHEVCVYNVLTPAVRHLRRFECQGVNDSCRNFTYIPANRSPDTIDNIYYICFH